MIREPRPEADLLVLCARKALTESDRLSIRELCQSAIDWNLLARAAENHKLSALVYDHLKQVSSDLVPLEVTNSLRNRFIERARLQWNMTDELVELSKSLASSNINHVCVKGPALAERLYGAIELRQFDDLDILVSRKDVAAAVAILRDRGFRPFPWRGDRQLPEHFFGSQLFLELCSEYAFQSDRNGVIVDLHWQVLPSNFFKMTESELFEHTIPAQPSEPLSTSALKDEVLLLILCAHATKHAWSKIGWVTDVAELIRSMPSSDWTRLLSLARCTNTKDMLLLGFALSAEIAALDLPLEIESQLQTVPRIARLCREIVERYRNQPCAPQWRRRKTLLVHLTALDSWAARVRLLLDNFFQPTLDEWTLLPLPRSLYCFYFALRPLNILREFIAWRAPGNFPIAG